MTIKLAESNLGKSAIFMLSWKILYKDIIGLIVGFFLLITVAVIMVKVLNQIKETDEKNDGDFTDTSAARLYNFHYILYYFHVLYILNIT